MSQRYLECYAEEEQHTRNGARDVLVLRCGQSFNRCVYLLLVTDLSGVSRAYLMFAVFFRPAYLYQSSWREDDLCLAAARGLPSPLITGCFS